MRYSAGTWSVKTSEVPAFPMDADAETVSRIRLQSGMHFPVEPRLGNDVPFA